MVIKGNVKIIKGEKQKPNIHFVFKRLGFTLERKEKGEKERKERKGERKGRKWWSKVGDVIFFFSFKLSKCSTSDSKGEEPKETKNK